MSEPDLTDPEIKSGSPNLTEVLDSMDREFGVLDDAAMAWARDVLRLPPSRADR